MLRYVTLSYVTLRYVTLRYVTLRYATLRYVTLRYVMLCYVMLCYVMLCYVDELKHHLVDELNLNTDSFLSFKSSLLKYYESSLYSRYNVDNPRSYKTICPKCNSVRSLTTSSSCCICRNYSSVFVVVMSML